MLTNKHMASFRKPIEGDILPLISMLARAEEERIHDILGMRVELRKGMAELLKAVNLWCDPDVSTPIEMEELQGVLSGALDTLPTGNKRFNPTTLRMLLLEIQLLEVMQSDVAPLTSDRLRKYFPPNRISEYLDP